MAVVVEKMECSSVAKERSEIELVSYRRSVAKKSMGIGGFLGARGARCRRRLGTVGDVLGDSVEGAVSEGEIEGLEEGITNSGR